MSTRVVHLRHPREPTWTYCGVTYQVQPDRLELTDAWQFVTCTRCRKKLFR